MTGTNPLTGWEVGTLPLADVFGQPGLAFFQGVVEGRYPMPPIAGVIPMAPIEATEGSIVFRSVPEGRFMNPIGSVHGGYAGTLLDTAMSCAVHTTLAAGEGYTTVEFKCIFHRAIQPDAGEVRASGKVISRGRRMAAAEGRITGADGRLLASGTTTCMIFPIPQDAS